VQPFKRKKRLKGFFIVKPKRVSPERGRIMEKNIAGNAIYTGFGPELDPSDVFSNGSIYYVPSNCGLTQQFNQQEIYYFGVVYTIPAKDFPHNLHKHEIAPEDLLTVLREPQGYIIPVENGLIERYEIHDLHANDIHVMYRVPYRRKR